MNVAVMTEPRFGPPPLAMVEIVDRSTDEVVQRPIAYPDGGDGRGAGDGRGPADREERPGRGRASGGRLSGSSPSTGTVPTC